MGQLLLVVKEIAYSNIGTNLGNNSYYKKLNLAIRERTALLKKYPKMGNPTTFIETRTVSLSNYSIFYKIQDQNIIITSFWDNRQDPEKLLKFLKKN